MEELQNFSTEELKNIVAKYPYFTAARLALTLKANSEDKLIVLLRRVGAISVAQNFVITKKHSLQSTTDSIIDVFLSKGDYKIRPNNSASDEDLSLTDNPLNDDDIISEELAEILLLQGLNQQAKQMYLKLSLLYPKKSVYFAEIISKIKG